MIRNSRCPLHFGEISGGMKTARAVSTGGTDGFASGRHSHRRKTRMWQSHLCCGAPVVLCSIMSIFLVGCNNKFLDPTQIGRFRPVPAVNVILDSLGVAEETPSAWEGAEEPRPIDVMVLEADYVFSAGDYLRVSVFELLQEGVLFTDDYIITETGKMSIPVVGVVEAAGLTESQLEEELKQILEPGILREPSLTVTLLRSERRTFSILGNGVAAPGRYFIPRYALRLADALATAGGISEFNVSDIYVSRPVTGEEVEPAPVGPEVVEPEKLERELVVPEQEMLEIVAPRAGQRPENGLVVTSAEMITDRELTEAALPAGLEGLSYGQSMALGKEAVPGMFAEPVGSEVTDEPVNEDKGDRIEWIFQDGRWVPVQVGRPRPTEPVKLKPEKLAPLRGELKKKVPADFEWDEIGTGGVQTRVIKIPVDRFQAGDPRYNIVIRAGDTIYVPVDIIGEFYITGNVKNSGAVPLTGRPMTLMQAIAAAGGLGPLAWPKCCEVRRRLGKDREEIVMVDLDRIARGEQPDFFIKINDLINVGTHPTARWRAVLRNAFGASYGFGFSYSRNFAYPADNYAQLLGWF